MAQTISELEKERAKLLEAIENQASQISAKRSGSNEARPHTLNDWLNAAEQVLPADEKPAAPVSKPSRPQALNSRPQKPQSKPPVNTASNKASFFGVIIMLSLLMTIIGVVYIAYSSAQKEMQQLVSIHNETLEKLDTLEQELLALKTQVEQGGDSDAFSEVVARLDRYEQEIEGLKNLQAGVERKTQQTIDTQQLAQVSTQLERQLNERLAALMNRLEQAGIDLDALAQAPQKLNNEIKQPLEPVQPTEPSVPRIEQKVVKLIQTQAGYDSEWISDQTPSNFTLQLASMADVSGLKTIISKHDLKDTKIVPQMIDGKKTYVLLSGSHSERTAANQASIEIKKATGINPWIRKMQDITARMN